MLARFGDFVATDGGQRVPVKSLVFLAALFADLAQVIADFTMLPQEPRG